MYREYIIMKFPRCLYNINLLKRSCRRYIYIRQYVESLDDFIRCLSSNLYSRADGSPPATCVSSRLTHRHVQPRDLVSMTTLTELSPTPNLVLADGRFMSLIPPRTGNNILQDPGVTSKLVKPRGHPQSTCYALPTGLTSRIFQ